MGRNYKWIIYKIIVGVQIQTGVVMDIKIISRFDGNSVVVDWLVDSQQRGITTVVVPNQTQLTRDNILAAAELITLSNIVSNKNTRGFNTNITVSKGVIKKIHLGKSEPGDLYSYTYTLLTVLNQATIYVSKDSSWVQAHYKKMHKSTTELKEVPVILNTVKFGCIEVSLHAYNQFKERLDKSPKDIFSMLKRKLRNKKLKVVQLPTDVLIHKQKKYHNVGTHLNIPGDKIYFVMKSEGDRHILVTSYYREMY